MRKSVHMSELLRMSVLKSEYTIYSYLLYYNDDLCFGLCFVRVKD